MGRSRARDSDCSYMTLRADNPALQAAIEELSAQRAALGDRAVELASALALANARITELEAEVAALKPEVHG